ncbi:SMI1/KNR4 family protein [Actinoplanes sp. CA-051413]|uniref:SMI1/KNR4 family protein n=1 Tax=Actinoplanes sp. CA-051413 TaxID=3239899 RepID=UPI003D968926
MPWPDGGPWVLATTSASVDWQPAAAALAAASTVRVAALVFGAESPPGQLLLGELATFLQAGDGAADPLSVDEAVALVRTLARTHGLVLVVGVPGLLVPTGRAGWTLMDLAVAVSAPVVVITGTGPDAANHTTLALGAVAGHGLTAAVITVDDPLSDPNRTDTAAADAAGPGRDPVVGDRAETAVNAQRDDAAQAEAAGQNGRTEPDSDAEQPAAAPQDEESDSASAPADPPPVPDHEAGMPVRPAGRIPADLTDHTDDFPTAAKQWLHPLLHASAGRPKAETPPPPPQPLPPPATASGKRVVLLLAGVFVSMSLVVCGLAFCQPTARTVATLEQVTIEPAPRTKEPERPRPRPRPRPVSDVCPQNQGRVTPTTPNRATTKRVNAAWKRIEIWLAAHAPATRRSLQPPADAKRIDAAQRRMSVAFPADLVASLRRHDGVSHNRGTAFTLPFFYGPMAVSDIPAEWLTLCGVVVEVFGQQDSTWWDKAFVPFASSGDGGNLFVDQRPGSHSRVGEFYNEDGVSFEEWPASVTELLEKTADSLETGRAFGGSYRPKVTKQGVLEWDVH